MTSGNTLRLLGMFVLGIACVQIVSGCSEGEKTDATIKVAGSTTVLPVVSKTAERFMDAHPNVKITINPGGSGVGVKSVGSGLVDIGMASRDITAEEMENFVNVVFEVHAIGRDAVACVVSSEIYDAGVRTLSDKQIRRIYSGEINNWKEVGGPNKEIFCIDKEAHRGTRQVFMAYIFADAKAKAMGADLVSGSNNEEQTKIALSDAAIGMLSHAWLNEDVKGVGIEVDGTVIRPTIENIKGGTYPISRDLNLITNGKPEGFLKQFIDYILGHEGQKIVEELGYVAVKEMETS
ncbi:phosphate ABC transporter substrate-binding protein [candidate division KSB1 bacterium]|nr:phosphate ABC transporter substrate-binding protein [candidate division KSB1 bacterium]NIR69353.1 phosphate ABC transporter substrate-binding protein [candidate division KSB1 bacterium]NIS24171.1 phosphate ABC transporter substrate-binding protein [candidate division KSB1 bacterium]NIT71086.1 phosphate ABC transporter substrate-binding protein [candidate division KSB1 bacterium]NIU24790.1 phosphate ABC transporter substrate-binding protein [candidate division KSB1 bacterium]